MAATVDLSFIEKKSSNKNIPKNEDAKLIMFKNITHLYMNDKKIKNIGDISVCEKLSVLYLHNNDISKIENLDSAVNLTALYLQRNRIKKIENLGNLRKLRRLYLGHNKISVVECLQGLENLEELHIEKQKLPKGDSLCFDPRSIKAISENLQILNIASNNVTSISNLAPLKRIKYLDASNNSLKNVDDICDTIRYWFYLEEATFSGNPVCRIHHYRESIIGNTEYLSILDNRSITENNRNFIKRLEAEKLQCRNSKQSVNLGQLIPSVARHYPLSLQKAVSDSLAKPKTTASIITNRLNEQGDCGDTKYVPWNLLPKTLKPIPALNLKQKQENKRNVFSSAITHFKC